MTPESLFVVRLVFACLFFVILGIGIHILRSYDRLFGVDPDVPSETESVRFFNKTQFMVLWVHALLMSAAFALMLH